MTSQSELFRYAEIPNPLDINTPRGKATSLYNAAHMAQKGAYGAAIYFNKDGIPVSKEDVVAINALTDVLSGLPAVSAGAMELANKRVADLVMAITTLLNETESSKAIAREIAKEVLDGDSFEAASFRALSGEEMPF